jgi:DNA-binding response OmpR family regulator
VRKFRWLNAEAIPAACDLRRRGWLLLEGEVPEGCEGEGALSMADVPALAAEQCEALARAALASRARTLLLGVTDPQRRSSLLRSGFGEVVSNDTDLDEIEVRALRVVAHEPCEPRRRSHGPLTLDLIARDAFAGGRALGLHPREFGLLWRLMATPGEIVGKAQLLREVWRLRHEPETNSVAVHTSRLRTKLKAAGFSDLVETQPGGYVYLPPADRRPAVPLPDAGALDAYTRLADDLLETARVSI